MLKSKPIRKMVILDCDNCYEEINKIVAQAMARVGGAALI